MTKLARERVDAGIEVLRLDRPDARNAFDRELLAELLAALDAAAADEDVRVLVISTTSERALSAGADVREALDAEAGVRRMEEFARMYGALEAFPAPTIAVATGNCVGAGAEVVAGCDLRVGAPNLKLAWAGARLGVPVGPARLAPLVGLATAKDLVFTGRAIGLEEAWRLGLITRRADEGEAEATALALAREVCANDPGGLRRLKAMFADYDDTASRVARENAELVAFQRHGGGLPQAR